MDECIESARPRTTNGYLRYGHEMWHRRSMREHHVPIAGMDVRHICGNRWCENFDHLTVGSRADNMRDAIGHGTTTRGERNVHAKLTEDLVRKIRLEVGLDQHEIAAKYNVSQPTVSRVLSRKTWRYLDDDQVPDGLRDNARDDGGVAR